MITKMTVLLIALLQLVIYRGNIAIRVANQITAFQLYTSMILLIYVNLFLSEACIINNEIANKLLVE